MNLDTIAGEGTNLKGRIKESLGDAVGDPVLRQDGASDQIEGNARKTLGALKDFIRDRPIAAAAGALVLGGLLFGGFRRTSRG
jgi:uncharacterized protein YjbJ (UPF0337 family)